MSCAECGRQAVFVCGRCGNAPFCGLHSLTHKSTIHCPSCDQSLCVEAFKCKSDDSTDICWQCEQNAKMRGIISGLNTISNNTLSPTLVIETDNNVELRFDNGTTKFILRPDYPDDLKATFPIGSYGTEPSNGQFQLKWDFNLNQIQVNIGLGGYIEMTIQLTDAEANQFQRVLKEWESLKNKIKKNDYFLKNLLH